MASKTLKRIERPEGSEFANLTREQLLSHSDEVGAALELRRRAINRAVRKAEKNA
jgi:hypothetical protein